MLVGCDIHYVLSPILVVCDVLYGLSLIQIVCDVYYVWCAPSYFCVMSILF